VAQLDDGHDVQDPVDAPGSEPGQEMSAMSPMRRAAPDGPIPLRSVSELA
jgi:hypothetical protein